MVSAYFGSSMLWVRIMGRLLKSLWTCGCACWQFEAEPCSIGAGAGSREQSCAAVAGNYLRILRQLVYVSMGTEIWHYKGCCRMSLEGHCCRRTVCLRAVLATCVLVRCWFSKGVLLSFTSVCLFAPVAHGSALQTRWLRRDPFVFRFPVAVGVPCIVDHSWSVGGTCGAAVACHIRLVMRVGSLLSSAKEGFGRLKKSKHVSFPGPCAETGRSSMA